MTLPKLYQASNYTFDEDSWDKTISGTLYHGTRQLGSTSDIHSRGLRTFSGREDAEAAVRKATRAFGRENRLDWPSSWHTKANLRLFDETPSRKSIYGTAYPDVAKSYAHSSPEIVWFGLREVKVPTREAVKYLEKEFGRRHLVTFKHPMDRKQLCSGYGPTDCPTGKAQLLPSDILSVDSFPEDDFLSKYSGQGWVKVRTLGKLDAGNFSSLLQYRFHQTDPKELGLKTRSYKGRITSFKVD